MNEDFEKLFEEGSGPRTGAQPTAVATSSIAPNPERVIDFETEFSGTPPVPTAAPSAPRAAPRTSAPAPAAPRTRPPTMTQVARRPPEQPEPDLTFREAASQGFQNLPESTMNMLGAFGSMFTDPTTTLKGLGMLGSGAVSKVAGALGKEQDPQEKARREAVVDALADQYAQTYGSKQGFYRALAKDPATVLSDLAMVGTGGATAAAKAAGTSSRAGQVASKAATALSNLDPVMASITLAKKTGAGISAAGRGVSGTLSGIAPRHLQIAQEIGQSGTAAQREMFQRMKRGVVDQHEMVDLAENALARARTSRNNNYRMAMGNRPPALVDFTQAGRRLGELRDEMIVRLPNGQTIPKNRAAIEILDRIENEVLAPIASQAAGSPSRNIFNADAAKQSIGELQREVMNNPQALRVATDMYNELSNAIKVADPDYAKVMKEYSEMSDFLNQTRMTLGVGRKISDATILKRLVKADNKEAQRLISELAEYEPQLPAAIAGAAVSEWMPSGQRQILLGTLPLMTSAVASPVSGILHYMGQTALASPRLAGNVAYGTGRAAGMVDPALQYKYIAPAQIASRAAEEVRSGEELPPEEETEKPEYEEFFSSAEGEGVRKVGAEQGGNALPPVGESFRRGLAPRTPDLELDFSLNRPTRNRNPGNVEASPWAQKQQGYIGSDGRFAVFDTVENGHAASRNLLANKLESGTLNTPRKLIEDPRGGWDPTAGPTYVDAVAKAVGIGPDDPFPTGDPDLAEKIYRAIRRIEGHSEIATGGRIERKAGGRIPGVQPIVNELMSRVQKARRETNKSTEPLLNHPDEAIVKALDVAQQAI